MQQAKTPEQYYLLADYFRAQERALRLKAAAEQANYKQLLERQTSSKYPTRAELQKALYQHHTYKAAQMADLAARYEQKVGENSMAKTFELQSGNADTVSAAEGQVLNLTPTEEVLLKRIEVLERQALQPETTKN